MKKLFVVLGICLCLCFGCAEDNRSPILPKRRMLTLFVLISRTVFKKYMMIQKASRRYYQRLRLENERRNNRFKIIRQQKNMER